MRKLILFFLVAMTFFGTTTVMAKPAFTDISIQASTADWNSSDTKSEFTTPDEKVEDSVPSETPEQPNISIKQPHQHQFNVQSQNPTCTKPGYTKEVCECGMMKNNIVLPSIQHAYDKKVKHPTCT